MKTDVILRDVMADDLTIFFEQQLDEDANFMAAFTVKDPADRSAFTAHWAKILSNTSGTVKTILFEGHVAGYIASFVQFGELEVCYWLGKEYWGRGIATDSLRQFLAEITARPLYARAVADNATSLRVLEKCGFRVSGYDKAFANARGEEVEEVILTLAVNHKGTAAGGETG